MPDNEEDTTIMTQSYGDITVAHFLENRILDETTIQGVTQDLLDLGDNSYKLKLVLNFSNVSYLSSAVLGKLVQLHKRIQEGNGGIKLCEIKPEIREVFEITKLDNLFDIRETQDEAVNAFKSDHLTSG